VIGKHRLCLSIDAGDARRAQALAREFRSCTTMVKLGPSVLVTEGPHIIRSLGEMGINNIIVDLRLFGNHREIWVAVQEASSQSGVRAITIQSCQDVETMHCAVQAAQKSMQNSHRADPPAIIVVALPLSTDRSAFCCHQNVRNPRQTYITRLTERCCAAGVQGILVDYVDIQDVRRVSSDIDILANLKRRIIDPLQSMPPEEMARPDILAVLDAGATHVLYDTGLMDEYTKPDQVADFIRKELDRVDQQEIPYAEQCDLFDDLWTD
jgi:orotidine-5'-phosphate decarboxylase